MSPDRCARRDAARVVVQRRLLDVLDQLVDVLVDLGAPERVVDQAAGLATAVGALDNLRALDRNTATALTEALRRAGDAT